MPSNNVAWGKRPSIKTVQPVQDTSALDSFVNPGKDTATKRLNAQIPATLHARIKSQCALAGKDMTQTLIEILEQHFPEK